MKARLCIASVIAGLTVFCAGFFIGRNRSEKTAGEGTVRVERVTDTVRCYLPAPQTESVTGLRRYTLPASCFAGGFGARWTPDSVSADSAGVDLPDAQGCQGDSVIADLPVVQRHYADSTYEAWVSGPVDPRLDSLNVFVPATVITRQEWRPPKRWHIGPTVGFGITPRGFEPYFGFSVTYSIISF